MTQVRPSAWAFRNFRLYFYSSLLLPFAAQIQSLIIGWQVYEIKRDPLFLGFIGLVEAAPALSLGFFAGLLVDQGHPLGIYRKVSLLVLVSAVLLLVTSLPALGVAPDRRIAALYVAAFLAGIARGFRSPSTTALIPQLVPREALHISSAWGTSAFSMASAVGPAIGGLIYSWWGPLAPYSLNIAFILCSIILVYSIRIDPQAQPPKRVSEASFFSNLTAGLKYVFGHQLLLGALAMDMFAVLFGGAVAMLPIFAGEILHRGPVGLGILRSSPSAGAVLGSVLLIRFPVARKSGFILLSVVAGFGFCMVGFGLSTSFVLSCVLLFLGGALDSVSMVIRGAIVQLSAPAEMKGRIGAVNSMFIGVSNQLGEFESGVAAHLLGTAPSVVYGGLVTLLVVVITAIKAPKLRQMEISKL